MSMSTDDPLSQDESATLEAELRQALQHRDAELARAEEIRTELRQLMARAEAILKRRPPGGGEG